MPATGDKDYVRYLVRTSGGVKRFRDSQDSPDGGRVEVPLELSIMSWNGKRWVHPQPTNNWIVIIDGTHRGNIAGSVLLRGKMRRRHHDAGIRKEYDFKGIRFFGHSPLVGSALGFLNVWDHGTSPPAWHID